MLSVCSYIDGSRQLQEEFVMLVDKLCEPGSTYKQIKRYSVIHVDANVSKTHRGKMGLPDYDNLNCVL